MTKQPGSIIKAARDRPASEARQKYDRIGHEALKSLERVQNTLTLKGCAFCEAYVEGRLRIVLEYGPKSGREPNGAKRHVVLRHEREVPPSSASRSVFADDLKLTNACFDLGRDEDVVLVSDVEAMNAIKIVPSVLERFDIVQDAGDDCLAGEKSVFLSLQGGFRALPITVEWEARPAVNGAAVGFDERTVAVVQGSSEIMNSVPYYKWRVLRNRPAKSSEFPSVLIKLGIKRADVLCSVAANNAFELRDVMMGPFYL